MNEGFCTRIEVVETPCRTDPHDSIAVFKDRPDGIVTQAVRVVRIVPVVRKLSTFKVKFIKPAKCTHPNCPGPVFENRSYRIIAQTLGVFRIMPVADETLRFAAVLVEAAIPGANPESAALVQE